MSTDLKTIQTFGFLQYKTGGVIGAEDEKSLKIQQEIFHSDIDFLGGWLVIVICLTGGVIFGITSQDTIVKTAGFALASSSLGAVIQRHSSRTGK